MNKRYHVVMSCIVILMMTACNKQPEVAVPVASQQEDMTNFIGCYTVDKNLPAQIKISQTDGRFYMQMKEPSGAKSAWDAPEPLETISVDKAWESFSVNALSLNKSDVKSVLARPDGVMLLANIHDASKNINPLLDSNYVVYIFRGSNTIYQVACDDKPLDIIQEGEATIKKSGIVKQQYII